MSPLEEFRYWKVRRDIERLEGLVCFAISYVTHGAVSVFWIVFGFLTILHLWTWIERKRGRVS